MDISFSIVQELSSRVNVLFYSIGQIRAFALLRVLASYPKLTPITTKHFKTLFQSKKYFEIWEPKRRWTGFEMRSTLKLRSTLNFCG